MRIFLRTGAEEKLSRGEAWHARSTLWHSLNRRDEEKITRFRRPSERKPLILAGHGVSLRVDHGALHIRGGRTHHPQKPEEYRFFPAAKDRPTRIIILDGSGAVTFDVIDWLATQNIPLIRINWQGEVITVIGSGLTRSTDGEKAAEQAKAHKNGQGLAIAIDLVRQKLENGAETLRVCLPASSLRNKSIATLEDSARGLIDSPPLAIGSLLGIEGSSAVAYFNAWQEVLLKWVGTRRHPIPREWLTIGTRSSERNLDPGKNGRATHPVNAILNYAYAILEAQVRIQLVAEGYDQSISYLHVSRPNRPGLVLDLMEPLRPIVDREVLRFLQAQTFKPGDFTLRSDGVCRLNPEMARRVVGVAMGTLPIAID